MMIPNIWENKSHVPVTTNLVRYEYHDIQGTDGYGAYNSTMCNKQGGDWSLQCRVLLRLEPAYLQLEKGVASSKG